MRQRSSKIPFFHTLLIFLGGPGGAEFSPICWPWPAWVQSSGACAVGGMQDLHHLRQNNALNIFFLLL